MKQKHLGWAPPGPVARIAALGTDEDPIEDQILHRACCTCCGICHDHENRYVSSSSSQRPPPPHGSFEPKTSPRPGEWLADGQPGEEERFGQSYKVYARGKKHQRRRKFPSSSSGRTVIYLCNLDANDEGGSHDSNRSNPSSRFVTKESMERLRSFAEAFFSLPCKIIMDAVSASARSKFDTRTEDGLGLPQQYATGPIHKFLRQRKGKLSDAFAVVGITMMDIYPERNWNFAFGEADPDKGVGVCSLARFDSNFQQRWENAVLNSTPSLTMSSDKQVDGRRVNDIGAHSATTSELLFWKRTMKLLCHEIGHLFHMDHCVYYECLMNGAKHLEEIDQSPLHLCPVCLRKLQYAVGVKGKHPFHPLTRYQSIAEFYYKNVRSNIMHNTTRTEWDDEALWVQGAMRRCCSSGSSSNIPDCQLNDESPFCACCMDKGMAKELDGDLCYLVGEERSNAFRVFLEDATDSDGEPYCGEAKVDFKITKLGFELYILCHVESPIPAKTAEA